MKRVAALLLLLTCSSTIGGQEKAEQAGRPQYVVLPPDQVLMVIANQPGCPLKIEEASFLLRLDKPAVAQRYRVRNVSSKTIKYFSIVSWTVGGAGGTLPLALSASGRTLSPGESFDPVEANTKHEVIPLTEDIRQRLTREGVLNFNGGMKNVYILMVDYVSFTDDSTYQDQRTAKALHDYLSKFDSIE